MTHAKKLTFLLISLSVPFLVLASPRPPEQRDPQRNQTAQVVLANFANIVSNFIVMAGNPHDKQTLIAGGCAIVGCLTNIAQEAIKLIIIAEGDMNETKLTEFLYRKFIDLKIHELIASEMGRNKHSNKVLAKYLLAVKKKSKGRGINT